MIDADELAGLGERRDGELGEVVLESLRGAFEVERELVLLKGLAIMSLFEAKAGERKKKKERRVRKREERERK